MNAIKHYLIFVILIFTCISFRVYNVSKYDTYLLDNNTLYLYNDTYTLVTNDDLLVTNEKEILGIASNSAPAKSFDDYLTPHYIKNVDANMDGEYVMVSGIMWDGTFRKN